MDYTIFIDGAANNNRNCRFRQQYDARATFGNP